MQKQKRRHSEIGAAQSRQAHCISIFGLQVEIDRKMVVDGAIVISLLLSGYAAMTIMAAAHCAGVI